MIAPQQNNKANAKFIVKFTVKFVVWTQREKQQISRLREDLPKKEARFEFRGTEELCTGKLNGRSQRAQLPRTNPLTNLAIVRELSRN